ncbi:threonine aldolase [Chryseobacterium sp. Leaf180]|uniref:threonine aldolase family protein n=1 Tax=Chryseobacterium sp. Leaf180 TaxID=1736289 RepID=UPI00070143BC|nr:aminotransferase class V-fold PLP-dependent enzyme [Chryseobacterium sp. Leaf180]KQR94621.1 threonine aldolase [Chryseobacterium sp. Leaf180]
MKFSFKNDYAEGCHPNILKLLTETNDIQQAGYGEDQYSVEAKHLIRKKLNDQLADIYFVSGGTQANLIVISSLLKPYQCAISASSGHILNNETGAIEATGHKIISVDSGDGKLWVSDIQNVLDAHQNIPHQVMPKLVYLSNSTEVGTVYTKQELTEISNFCRKNWLYLFLDGARLGQALTSEKNDLEFSDLAQLVDVFYLGGTKNGALLGEAIIILNENLKQDFAFNIKQKGALLAKGRLLGIQFLGLMQDDLYFELAKHANLQAMKIKNSMLENQTEFLSDTFTNQIFPVLKNDLIEKLAEKFEFYVWKKISEEKSAIRIITSWNTPDAAVNDFIETFQQYFMEKS